MFSLIATKLACRDDWGGGGDHDSCRMREIEVVRTVELVCVGRLLRMGSESFLLPVWCEDLLEVDSLPKGSWMSG